MRALNKEERSEKEGEKEQWRRRADGREERRREEGRGKRKTRASGEHGSNDHYQRRISARLMLKHVAWRGVEGTSREQSDAGLSCAATVPLLLCSSDR